MSENYLVYTGSLYHGGKSTDDAASVIAKLVANNFGRPADFNIAKLRLEGDNLYYIPLKMDDYRGRITWLCNREIALNRKKSGAIFPEIKVGDTVMIKHPLATVVGEVITVDYVERDYSMSAEEIADYTTNIIGYGLFIKNASGEIFEWKSLIDGGTLELV